MIIRVLNIFSPHLKSYHLNHINLFFLLQVLLHIFPSVFLTMSSHSSFLDNIKELLTFDIITFIQKPKSCTHFFPHPPILSVSKFLAS